MEKFIYENILFAIIVRENFHRDGIFFVTDGTASLEMGYMSHPAGYTIKPHKHLPFARKILSTQEVLFLKTGKLRVNFYSDQNICIGNAELHDGDWIILLDGGHGFDILEPSIFYEIKNGPYAGDKDKIRFEPISPGKSNYVAS